jgi:hypothetical protein
MAELDDMIAEANLWCGRATRAEAALDEALAALKQLLDAEACFLSVAGGVSWEEGHELQKARDVALAVLPFEGVGDGAA